MAEVLKHVYLATSLPVCTKFGLPTDIGHVGLEGA